METGGEELHLNYISKIDNNNTSKICGIGMYNEIILLEQAVKLLKEKERMTTMKHIRNAQIQVRY